MRNVSTGLKTLPVALGICAIAAMTHAAQAAMLVQYGFNGTLEPYATPSGVSATNITETGFSVGAAANQNPAYSTTAQEGTHSRAVRLNTIDTDFGTDDYYEFTLTPTGGQVLDLTSLTYYSNVSSTGGGRESKYQLRYDDLSDGAGNFITLGENALLTSTTFIQQIFDLSGVAFDNLTAGIVFRLDVADTGNDADNTTVRLDNLVVDGSVIVPEPASLALLALGGLTMLPRRRK